MGSARTLPKGRPASEFLVEALADEVLVYDRSSDRAHCLAPAAALVWQLCDGKTSFADAERALRASGAEDRVSDIVAHLVAAGLVRQPARRTVDASRRRLLGRGAVVAGAVLASPVIFSIVAPSVAEAASSVGCGKKTQPCCTTAPQCQAPLRCIGGICQ